MAGRRSQLFEYVDRLDEAADVKTLVQQLKPLLHFFVHNYIHSDAAALEDHDAWHDEFAAELARGAQADGGPRPAAPAPAPAAASAALVPRKGKNKGKSRGKALKNAGAAAKEPSTGALKARARARSGAEAPAEVLPASLRMIWDGTHESLRDSDSD